MAKTITAGMRTHLASDTTTLATAWHIRRTDGEVFTYNTSSEDQSLDFGLGDGTQTFKSAGEGYNRSSLQNDAELNVGNMEVVGIFNELDETELRRGLFDFAEVHIAVFNHQDTSFGLIKMTRANFSEVTVTPYGFFNVELRDVTQLFSKQFGEHYSKDCRADLGDARCGVPLLPDVLSRNTAVSLGEFYRVQTDPVPQLDGVVMVVPGDVDADDKFGGRTGTLGSQAQVQTTVTKIGAGAIEFSPSGSADPSNAFVSYPDGNDIYIGTNQFTIELWVRFKDLTATNQVMASQYLNTGNQRSWNIRRANGNAIRFGWSTTGADDNAILRTFAFSIDTWYHIAVTRDASDDMRLFVDGVQQGATVNSSDDIFNSSEVMRLGKFRSAGTGDQPLFGFVDDYRFTVGKAFYTSNFTPPGAHPLEEPAVDCTAYEDRMYEVTTAGTTQGVQPTYDTTVNNTTADGTAVLTARHSWFRAVTVDTVLTPRRAFRVTELTPNSGQSVSAGVPTALGFPDDWFNGGVVRFDTGNNAGRSFEVKDFDADDGVTIEQDVTLWGNLPFDIQVGDVACILPGCDKVFGTCIAKFDNAINFVGEPFVPSPDIFGQYPDARS